MKFAGIVCFLIAQGVVDSARAADPFYLGNWTFTAATVAPWADPQRRPDDAERSRLIGKSIVLKATEISGPSPFACTRPKYRVADYSADMIFQGAFDDMPRVGKKGDSAILAAGLGFAGARIKTLETGCEIDFHFVDDTTAKAGLNNYVYTLKRR